MNKVIKIMRKIILYFILFVLLFIFAGGNLVMAEYYEGYEYPETEYDEPFRPQYHFSSQYGWLNDPNGLIYYDGYYHLFYQHDPLHVQVTSAYWGHARSKDMVHWEQLPVALYTDKYGLIFSGTCVVDKNNDSGFFPGGNGVIAFFTYHSDSRTGYTGPGEYTQSIGMAYSSDCMDFTKIDGPILSMEGVADFRDPKVFYHEESEKWVMLAGADKLRIFTSDNLRDWELKQTIPMGTECPDMFKLPVDGDENNAKWVITMGGRQYMIGEFDGETFTQIGNIQSMHHGIDAYAGQSFANSPDGRVVMMQWMSSWEFPGELSTLMTNFANAMTIPVELSLKTLDGEICLIQTPVKELETLKDKEITGYGNIYLCDNEEPIDCGTSAQSVFDISVNTASTTASELKINLFETGEQVVVLSYNFTENSISLDRRKGSDLTGGIVGRDEKKGFNNLYTVKIPPKQEKNSINLKIFTDSSSIEIFVNDGEYVLNYNVLPNRTPFKHTLHSVNGNIDFNYIKVETMKSIWNIDNTENNINDGGNKEQEKDKTDKNWVIPLVVGCSVAGVSAAVAATVIIIKKKK